MLVVTCSVCCFFFFFSSRRRHTRLQGDWSSDVCSSDLLYLDSLKMLFDLFNRSRREGLTAIEEDLEAPEKSKTFTAFPSVIKDHHVRDFICDTLRTASSGAVEPFDIDQMMELDMEVHRSEE